MAAKYKKFYMTCLRENDSQHVASWSHPEPWDWPRELTRAMGPRTCIKITVKMKNEELSLQESEGGIGSVE